MKRIFLTISVLFLFVFFSSAHAALTVYLDASPGQNGGDSNADTVYSLQPGDTFWVNILADDLQDVSAMGFDLSYDPTQLLVLNLAAADPPWSFQPNADDDGNGLMEFDGGVPLAIPPAPVSGDMVLLGYAQFECLAPGSSFLDFATPASSGRGFFDADGKITDITYTDMRVNQIPIPSTVLLLGGGLVALVGLRRRKSA